MAEKKSRPPPFLKNILAVDKQLTAVFVRTINGFLPLRSLKYHYKALEISCHGIPWFAFWIAFTWIFNKTAYIQLQINMLLGLFLDIVFIAILKAYFRRKRPVANTDDALGQIGPDVFSFPSGHVSRAVFVFYVFTKIRPIYSLFTLPLFAWVASICLSRVLMHRHYLLDILGGIILGLFNGVLMEFLWLSYDTSVYILSFVSDETIEGAEYHV